MRPLVRRGLACLLLAVPLVAGTTFAAATDADMAATWTPAGQDASAPASGSVDEAALAPARQATGQAASQAGFLSAATEQLANGTTELNSGMQKLDTGATEAKDGAQQLADGMIQIQAGTGQLGDGATELADGVGTAVDQVIAFEAIRGQILGSVNRVLDDMGEPTDPKQKEFKDQLLSFKQQTETYQLDPAITDQLTKVRDGSRELANQLDTPGYAYHDGIYSATEGAKQLSAGLKELDAGVDQALKGTTDLNNGAEKVDGMADSNKQKVGAIQRALPVSRAGTRGAQEAGITRTLAPMYAFLIAAAVLLGALIGKGNSLLPAGTTRRTVIGAQVLAGTFIAVLGAVLVFIVGSGISVPVAAGAGLVLGLLVAATAASTYAFRAIFGKFTGTIMAFVGALLQICIVGWVWNAASTSQVSLVWRILANMMPLNYPTAAITSLGNAAPMSNLWISVLVLAAFTVAAWGAGRFVSSVSVENDY